MKADENSWCVLRTSSRHTLGLAESLTADGYEVWTPVETRTIRVPRADDAKREAKIPIMASYVFARSDRLVDLLILEDMEVKPSSAGTHAPFTVMRAFGEISHVPDRDLNALRTREAKLTPKPKAEKTFGIGATVKVEGGIFGGLVGQVQRSDASHTLISFSHGRLVKIPTLLLREDGVCGAHSAVRKEAA